jgi:NAD(P)-dependent dehydrogenase (short-subunit alcohol dehydrogenase family)
VIATGRRAGDLNVRAAGYPGIHPVVLDVTGAAAGDTAREQVETRTGGYGLDVLNAAGVPILGLVAAVPGERARAQFEVNLSGSLGMTRAFFPPLRERGNGRSVRASNILGALTEKGRAHFPVIAALMHWGDTRAPGPAGPPAVLVHNTSGNITQPVLACRTAAARSTPARPTASPAREAVGPRERPSHEPR